MKHLKTYEDTKIIPKYHYHDYVEIDGPYYMQVLDIQNFYIGNGAHRLEYLCQDVINTKHVGWFREELIIRKVEDYEIQALKYNL
jgi:hypothetical protein